MKVEPRIVKKTLCLIGADSAIDFQTDFGPALEALRDGVKDRLRRARGVSQPARMVGFWFADGGQMRYFAGAEAEDGVCDLPEGLVYKRLPESL
ncbi:MAG: hypothetical protein GX558_02925, partial [Clostridiales bacterium]|nr:hypothetical protein [Clostridiales bacterium]